MYLLKFYSWLVILLSLFTSLVFAPDPPRPRLIAERTYTRIEVNSNAINTAIENAEWRSRRLFRARRYQTLEMDKNRQWQDATGGVEVFSEESLQGMKLEFKQGKIYHRGGLFTTRMPIGRTGESRGTTAWMYVMDEKGEFYVHPEWRHKWHHSSFFGGGVKKGDIWNFHKVAAAGMIVAEGGVLKSIDGASGHYEPDLFHFAQALVSLEGQGVSTEGVKVNYFDHEGKKLFENTLSRYSVFREEGFIRKCFRSLREVGS